jgi:hypothetical protein
MSAVLRIFLVVSYGAAWALASSRPVHGFLLLAGIGTLLSLPSIFQNILVGMLITALLTMLVAALPCLAPLLGIFVLIKILGKFAEIVRNFVLLVWSFLLYGLLLSAPLTIRTNYLPSFIDLNSTMLADLIMFVMGALIMELTCYAFSKLGHKRNQARTAAFIVGLPGFIILLGIFLFSLHGGPDLSDGSDNGA